MSCCAEFIVGRERELGGVFTAAVGAGGIGGGWQVGDAGKCLAKMAGRAVETEGEGCVARGIPVAAGGVAPEAGSVGLVGCAVVARLVETAAAHKEPQRVADVLGEEQAILTVDVAGDVDWPRWAGDSWM